MSDVFEVIFTSSDGDKTNTANVWNIQTGTNLMTYKDGGLCALKGLCLLGSDYVIGAEKNKPILKVWPVNSQLPLNNPRLLCTGIVTTIAVDPFNFHIAVAVQEKLHIYSVCSGHLLGTGARHFQPLTVLKWSSDGNIIVCGGEDGLVTVWLLSNFVVKSLEPEPIYVFSYHSLPVCDLFITPEGLQSHLISVSSDRTCKIYDMCEGTLLLSLIFDTMLTAVCTNTLESDVFVGTNNGGILQFSLHSAPRTKEYHLSTEEKAPVFVGHTKSITCLSNSLDGELLLSGSVDETAKIWHIYSKQCLRTITHKGQVTNAFFTIVPKQIFNNELKLSVYLSSFKKSEEEGSEVISVFTNTDLKLRRETRSNRYDDFDYYGNTDYTNSLEKQLEKAKSVNKQLYNFAVNIILDNDKHELCKDDLDTTEDGTVQEPDDNLVEHDITNEGNTDKLWKNGKKLKKNLKKSVSFQINQPKRLERHRKK